MNTALGSKAGKELDRETKTHIKEAERALEKATRHKKAEKLTPADVQAINAAREALSSLSARWSPVGKANRKAEPAKGATAAHGCA